MPRYAYTPVPWVHLDNIIYYSYKNAPVVRLLHEFL